MKINFDAIESRLKALVESSAQLVPGPQNLASFSSQLAAAVEAYLKEEDISDLDDFPKSLLLEVSTCALKDWQEFPVAETLQNLLQDAGLSREILPQIEISVNGDLLANEVLVRNSFANTAKLDKTAAMPALEPQADIILGDTIPTNAFIIVNGLETILLTQLIFNIGRRLENDLIIEDARISREHSQIRAVKGQYVIFDLNSAGGTFVNSVRVSQQPLYPGDVISLAGIPLVYGEDPPASYSNTGPMQPFSNSVQPGD
ncbi:MAG: FHA domain-containing protein [Leptolinea sp.]